MNGAEEQPRPRSRNLLALLLRALLHSAIKGVVVLFLALRRAFQPKVVRYGVVALLAAIGVGLYALNSMFAGAPAAPAQGGSTVSVQASQILPPAPEVERYLKAQASYDAKGMWDTISEELKAAMKQGSASPVQQLQAELDAARQQGRKYRTATYVGGVPTRDGMNVYFYVLTVDGPNGTIDVPYIYVLGRDGKIVSIQ